MRAIISGAGIAGLANARFLTDASWDMVIIEQAPARRQEGYMMDFFGPGYAAAEELALFESLPDSTDLRYGTTMADVRNGTDGASVVLTRWHGILGRFTRRRRRHPFRAAHLVVRSRTEPSPLPRFPHRRVHLP